MGLALGRWRSSDPEEASRLGKWRLTSAFLEQASSYIAENLPGKHRGYKKFL